MYIPPQCSGDVTSCHQLWSTDPTHDTGTIEQLVKNHNLNLVVVYLGFENFAFAVDAALKSNKHILFYNWSPSELTAAYASSVFRISFPVPTVDCLANDVNHPSGTRACDFEDRTLLKVRDGTVGRGHPSILTFFQNYEMELSYINAILAEVVSNGGKPDLAACTWIKANKKVWSKWIPKFDQSHVKLNATVGLILNSEPNLQAGNAFREGFQLGVETYANKSVLSLGISHVNDKNNQFLTTSSAMSFMYSDDMVAVVGSSSSEMTDIISFVSAAAYMTMVGAGSTSSSLRDRDKHSTLVRPYPDALHYLLAALSLAEHYQWKVITAIVTEEDVLGGLPLLINEASKGKTHVDILSIRADDTKDVIRVLLGNAKELRSRIIAVSVSTTEEYLKIFEVAKEEGMMGKNNPGYHWISFLQWYSALSQEQLNARMDDFIGVIDIGAAASEGSDFSLYEKQIAKAENNYSIILNQTGIAEEPVLYNPYSYIGFDVAKFMTTALSLAIKRAEENGVDPACMKQYLDFNTVLCPIPDALRKDVLALAQCTGVYNSTVCVQSKGILNIFNNYPANTELKIADILYLDSLYRMQIDTAQGKLIMTGTGETYTGIMHFRNGQALKNANGEYNFVMRKVASVQTFQGGGVPTPTILGKVHFAGGTLAFPKLSIPRYDAPPEPECAKDSDHVTVWFTSLVEGEARNEDREIAVLLVTLVMFVILIILIDIYALRKTLKGFEPRVKYTGEIRHSLSNYVALVIIGLEHTQIVRICLSANVQWLNNDNSSVSSLLDFVSLEFRSLAYSIICLCFALLWILYASIIYFGVDERLEKFALGKNFMKPSLAILVLVSTGLYLPIVSRLLSLYSCYYIQEYGSFYVLNVCKLECWSVQYWVVFSLFSVALYTFVPGTFLMGHIWQEIELYDDVKFKPKHFLFNKSYKTLLAIIFVNMSESPIPYLSCVFILSLVMCLWAWKGQPSYVTWVNTLLFTMPLTGLFTSLTLLFFEVGDVSNPVPPFITLLCIWAIIGVLACLNVRRFRPLFEMADEDIEREHNFQIIKIRLYSDYGRKYIKSCM